MADIKTIKAIREELLQTEIYYTKLCRKTKQEGDKAKYEVYKAKKISLIKKIMEIDFSWNASAQKYVDLYRDMTGEY